jgi:hypothetical protein
VVRHVEDHVSKFSLVDQLSAFWALEVVFFFFGRKPFVFINRHVLAPNLRGKRYIVFVRAFARKSEKSLKRRNLFVAERPLDSLADAGYQNGFEGLPLSERVTHPGTHGFPDATFDYVFAKGLTGSRPTITRTNASDHWPVTRNFRLH